MEDELVSIEDVREAARGMSGVVERTPLVRAGGLDELAGFPVYLKLENTHPTGAFKLRGAWTAVNRLSPQRRARPTIEHSESVMSDFG